MYDYTQVLVNMLKDFGKASQHGQLLGRKPRLLKTRNYDGLLQKSQ